MPPIVSIRFTLEDRSTRKQPAVADSLVIDRVMEAHIDRISDLRPAWPAVLDVFRGIAAKAFATEGGSTDDGRWKKLTLDTAYDRNRKGFPMFHPILERTGRLRRAVTLESDSTVTREPTWLRVTIDLSYFKYHQSTRERKLRKTTREPILPRRAMLSFTADDRYALIHPLRLYLTGFDPGARKQEARKKL
jgi:hypothetical protein